MQILMQGHAVPYLAVAGKYRHISLVPSFSQKFQLNKERPVSLHACGHIDLIKDISLA